MTTPYSHTHVSHLTRSKRRRSHSLTIPNSKELATHEHSIQQKHFLVQLQKERQKQKHHRDKQHDGNEEIYEEYQDDDDDHYQTTVIRIPRSNTSTTTKKYTSSTSVISVKEQGSSTAYKSQTTSEDEEFQPVVTRIATITGTTSMKNHASSTMEKNETTFRATQIPKTEQHRDHYSQITQVPRSESIKSVRKQLSTPTGTRANGNLSKIYKTIKPESSVSYNDVDLDSLQTSYNPFVTSSMNIISKPDTVDQEFHLDDSEDHVRRNDAKSHGSIKISDREKFYTVHGKRLATKSSASCMAAIIAIIIGVIAFALGLTAFILVLLLRASVEASLGTNSTTSRTGGSLPSSCSAYTNLNDPTRNIYAPGYGLGCDNTAPFINRTHPVWIRFTGTGGTTLPLSTPGMNTCGSTGTGWYSGTMPSSTSEIVNGTACFTWYTSVCRDSASISVANCGSFYIYLLPPPPVCMMRYCTI